MASSKKHDPDTMLQKVLGLIDDDIGRIRELSEKKVTEDGQPLPYDGDIAWTLCRYAELLNKTVKTEAVVDAVQSKKIGSMTTDELKAKARELLEGKTDK